MTAPLTGWAEPHPFGGATPNGHGTRVGMA